MIRLALGLSFMLSVGSAAAAPAGAEKAAEKPARPNILWI